MLASTILPLLALLAVPIAGRPVEGELSEVQAPSQGVTGACGRGGSGRVRYRYRNRTSTSIQPATPTASNTVELPISSASAVASDLHGSSASASIPGGVLVVTGGVTSSRVAATTTSTPVAPSTSSAAAVPSSATPVAAPVPATNAPTGDAATLLKLHNDFRAKYGAGPLTWNDELAKFAQDYASKCVFKHSGGPYGENLAAGAGGGYTATSGFNSWANEASKYNWDSPGFSSGTGHFTQVVWKATTELGCAVVQCDDGTIFSGMNGQKSSYVICEYRKGGNVVGNNGQYFRDNVGRLQG